MSRMSSWAGKAESAFLFIALLFGIGLCFVVPAGSGFDEITHLARIVQISGGSFLPNQEPYLPMAFEEINYRNNFFYDPVDPDFLAKYGSMRIDWGNYVIHQTRSVYFPAIYLPQALAVYVLGRLLGASVLAVFYSCRLLNLLGYVLLAYFAIRLIPFGKWLLAVLALAPMAMYQAATVSTDSFTNASSFLFLAWILHLAFQEKPLSWLHLCISIGMVALLFSVKVNAVFLLPLLILLARKAFRSRGMLPILVVMVAVLLYVEGILWNSHAFSVYYLKPSNVNALEQMGHILSHPLGFFGVLSRYFASEGFVDFKEWIAVYGYSAGQVPVWTYPLFGLGLVAAWLTSPAELQLTLKLRLTLILTGLGGILFTIILLYVTFNPVGSHDLSGVQGRYFIPFVPLLFLGLLPRHGIITPKRLQIARLLAITVAALALVAFLLGNYLSFYTYCGVSLYTPGLCYQPQYRNWESNPQLTPPVTQDVVLHQRFEAHCSPLRSIRVWGASLSSCAAGETGIVIKDPQENVVLAQGWIDNSTVADYAWVEWFFPPLENVAGAHLVLEITSDVSNPAAAISFGMSERREYRWGLLINNEPLEHDLMFQYGCEP